MSWSDVLQLQLQLLFHPYSRLYRLPLLSSDKPDGVQIEWIFSRDFLLNPISNGAPVIKLLTFILILNSQ